MRNGRVELSQARRIKPEHYVEWTRKAKPRPYDVVLSRRCNPGETAFVEPGTEFALGQNLVLLRADGSKVYPPFLRWLVRGPGWWEQVGKFINVGAVFDSLKCADIPNFELRVPTLPEQRAVASILGALDDKIDLNRRTNETLESIARAIFKSWFVDFDPVRAKAEGRQPAGMDAETAALFPGSFEKSADCLPTSWRMGRLDDCVMLQRGFDLPEPQRTPGAYPVIAASGPSGSHNEYKVKGPGVSTGRSGVLGRVFYVEGDFWPLNTSLYVRDYRASSAAHAYFLLSGLDFGLFNAGSAVPTLNRNHVHSLPVAVPPVKVVAAFERLTAPFFRLRHHNESQSRAIAEIRDALLPKLLSGKLRIRDAEKMVKDHV